MGIYRERTQREILAYPLPYGMDVTYDAHQGDGPCDLPPGSYVCIQDGEVSFMTAKELAETYVPQSRAAIEEVNSIARDCGVDPWEVLPKSPRDLGATHQSEAVQECLGRTESGRAYAEPETAPCDDDGGCPVEEAAPLNHGLASPLMELLLALHQARQRAYVAAMHEGIDE